MNVLITGADGLLGSNVVRELLAQDHSVTALVEKGKEAKTINGLPIQLVHGDILNASTVISTTKGMDAVIHCAAVTNIWPAKSSVMRAVNIEGTKHVIDACITNNVKRMVFIGTANSFSRGTRQNPGTEKNEYTASVYGLDYMDSKRKAQELVLEAVENRGLNATVVNPTFMLGPYDSKPSSGAMIMALLQEKVPCYTNGGKNYINVRDAAVGVVNALTMGRIGEAYILGNENLSFYEMFNKIGTVVGAKPPKIKLPSFLVKSYGRMNSMFAKLFNFTPAVSYEMSVLSCEDHYYSPQKAIDELQLPQTPIENGILDCYEWFIENGYYTPAHNQHHEVITQ